MAEVQRWVVVDPEDDSIVGGPYLWDGSASWSPPEVGRLVLEAEWLAAQPEPVDEPVEPEQPAEG